MRSVDSIWRDIDTPSLSLIEISELTDTLLLLSLCITNHNRHGWRFEWCSNIIQIFCHVYYTNHNRHDRRFEWCSNIIQIFCHVCYTNHNRHGRRFEWCSNIIQIFCHVCYVYLLKYRKTSNISRTLVGNTIVDNSDVVGASPVGAAPTTSSFPT